MKRILVYAVYGDTDSIGNVARIPLTKQSEASSVCAAKLFADGRRIDWPPLHRAGKRGRDAVGGTERWYYDYEVAPDPDGGGGGAVESDGAEYGATLSAPLK
ncbi:hypothetical protein MRX96_031603 [Rhipicephalus microplus]